MPAISIEDKKTYEKAIGLLVKRGGSFRTRAPQILIVNRAQFDALVEEGLVPPPNEDTGGQKPK